MTTQEFAYVDIVEPCFISLYLRCGHEFYGCNKDLLGVKSKFIKHIFFGVDGVDLTLLSSPVRDKPCIAVPDRFQHIIRQVLDHLSNSTKVHFQENSQFYHNWTLCFELLAFLQVEKFIMPAIKYDASLYSFDKGVFNQVLQLIETANRLGYKDTALSVYTIVLHSLDRSALRVAFYAAQKILEHLPAEFHSMALSFGK